MAAFVQGKQDILLNQQVFDPQIRQALIDWEESLSVARKINPVILKSHQEEAVIDRERSIEQNVVRTIFAEQVGECPILAPVLRSIDEGRCQTIDVCRANNEPVDGLGKRISIIRPLPARAVVGRKVGDGRL